MAENGVIFSEDAADRIAGVVEWAEDNGMPRDRRRLRRGPVQTQEGFDARVTSGTPDGSGHYDAQLTVWDETALAWTDYRAIKVKPRNGETLVSGTRYSVRQIDEVTVSGTVYPLWILAEGGGGSAVANATFSGGVWHVSSHLVEGYGILSLDNATGIAASNISSTDDDTGTDVLLSLAAATTGQWGVVTTTTQAFAGNKGFGDGVVVGTSAELTGTTPLILDRVANSGGALRGGVYVSGSCAYASDIADGTQTLLIVGYNGQTGGGRAETWGCGIGSATFSTFTGSQPGAGILFENAAGTLEFFAAAAGGGAQAGVLCTSGGTFRATLFAGSTTLLNLTAFNGAQQGVVQVTCQPDGTHDTLANNVITTSFNDGITALTGANGTLGGSGFITTIHCVAGWVTSVGTFGGSATNGQLLIGNGSGFSLSTITAGTGISITNGAGTITIACTVTGYTDEQAQDAVGGILTDTPTIDFTYDDPGNTIKATKKHSGCKLTNSTGQSVASGDVIHFDTALWDLTGYQGTNAIVVPSGRGGYYLVGWAVAITATDSGGSAGTTVDYCDVECFQGSTLVCRTRAILASIGGGTVEGFAVGSVLLNLSAGDSVTLQVFFPGSITSVSVGAVSQYSPLFWCDWVGT